MQFLKYKALNSKFNYNFLTFGIKIPLKLIFKILPYYFLKQD